MISSAQDSSFDDLLSLAMDDYLQRTSRGENVDVDEFVAGYPEITVNLRRLINAVRLAGPPSGQRAIKPTDFSGRQLGQFHVLRPLAMGGMGVVYVAEETATGRKLALKVLSDLHFTDAKQRQRFENEILAAATLDHPHIVRYHGFGEDLGARFYAMQLIEGQNVAEAIMARRQQSATRVDAAPSNSAAHFQQVARWGVDLARALHYAHERGIVHRDVKPSNLLIDNSHTIYITDFGLARVDGQATVTASGDLVGTLRYMSPEQASGAAHRVDARSDVYSLGITLYELATLQPAFPAIERQLLLPRVMRGQIVPARVACPSLPVELDTILAKATAADLDDRYHSAQELADDLQNFLDQRPIRARRATRLDVARRWMSRHPGVMLTALTAAMLMFLVMALSLVQIQRKNQQLRFTNQLSQRRATEAERERALRDSLLIAADLKLASEGLRQGHVEAARRRLQQYCNGTQFFDRDNFVWNYLWGEIAAHVGSFSTGQAGRDLSVSPDGTLLATAHDAGVVAVRKFAGGELLWTQTLHSESVTCVSFSADGHWLASGAADGCVCLAEVATGELIAAFSADSASINQVLWLGEGQLFTASGNSAHLWQSPWLEPVTSYGPHPHAVEALALSPDRQQLAVATKAAAGRYVGQVVLWDVAAASETGKLDAQSKCVSVAFHPAGQTIVAGTQEGQLAVWQLGATTTATEVPQHTSNILDVDFSRDGRFLATAGKDATVRVWDVQTWQLVKAYHGHARRAYAVHFHPDNRRLASIDAAGTIRLWDCQRSVFTQYDIPAPIHSADFVPSQRGYAIYSLERSGMLSAETLEWRSPSILPWASSDSGDGALAAVGGHSGRLFTKGSDVVEPLTTAKRFARFDVDADGDLDELACFGKNGRLVWQECDVSGRLLTPRLLTVDVPYAATPFRWQVAAEQPMSLFCLNPHSLELLTCHEFEPPWKVVFRDRCWFDVADLDGDGSCELLAAEWEQGEIRSYARHQVDAKRIRSRVIATGLPPIKSILAIPGDLDNHASVLAVGHGDGTIQLLQLDRPSRVGTIDRLSVGSLQPLQMDAVDIDGDGDRDLVVAGDTGMRYFRCVEAPAKFESIPRCIDSLQQAAWARDLPVGLAMYCWKTNRIIRQFPVYEETNLDAVAVTLKGDRIATVGSTNQVLRLWSHVGNCLAQMRARNLSIRDLAFSPDGKRLCVAIGDDLHIYEVPTLRRMHVCSGHSNTVSRLLVLPKRSQIITLSRDLTVRAWSWETGRQEAIFVGHSQPPTALTADDGERLLVTADRSGVVKLWDLDTSREVLELTDFHAEPVALGFASPNCLTVLGVEKDGQLVRSSRLGRWTVGGAPW